MDLLTKAERFVIRDALRHRRHHRRIGGSEAYLRLKEVAYSRGTNIEEMVMLIDLWETTYEGRYADVAARVVGL